jgi:hypothetical protein
MDATRLADDTFLVAIQGEQKIDSLSKNFFKSRNPLDEILQFGKVVDAVITDRAFVMVMQISATGKVLRKRRVSNSDDTFVQGILSPNGSDAIVFGSVGEVGAAWRVAVR